MKRPRVVLLVLLAVILIVGSVFVVMLGRYNPLREGSFSGTPVVPAGVRFSTDSATGLGKTTATYVQGGNFAVDFSIRNEGPWGITILAIPERDFGLFSVTELRRSVQGRCCVVTEPFAPFALHPGEERFIELRGVMKGCGNVASGAAVSWNSYRIRYQVIGLDHVRELEVRETIEIEIPNGYSCPERSAR